MYTAKFFHSQVIVYGLLLIDTTEDYNSVFWLMIQGGDLHVLIS